MAFFVGLMFIVALCIVGGFAALAARNGRQRLIAGAPAGALVGRRDTGAEARAKVAQYQVTLEAARILQLLLVRDQAVFFLTDQERQDITAWLENFYGRKPT